MTSMLLGVVVDNGRIGADFGNMITYYSPGEPGRDEFAADLRRELPRSGADTVNLQCGNSVSAAGDFGVYINVGAWLRAAIRSVKDLDVPEVGLSVPDTFTADDIRFLLSFVPSGLDLITERVRERVVEIRKKLEAYE